MTRNPGFQFENPLEQSEIVQAQFGDKAYEYTHSPIHAKGKSLERLLAITDPQPDWRVLDVATGAGHTAFAFANKVAQVVALDLTFGMLNAVREAQLKRKMMNLDVCMANAQELPFKDASFDLITCRIAAHHFSSVDHFMNSAGRLLIAGGHLAVVDSIIPTVASGRKRKRRSKLASEYINAFERLRDPSHQRNLTLEEWHEAFYAAGFRVWHSEELTKKLDFLSWVTRMQVSPANITRLKTLLLQAPEEVMGLLSPEVQDGKLTFTLTEAILVGVRDLH